MLHDNICKHCNFSIVTLNETYKWGLEGNFDELATIWQHWQRIGNMFNGQEFQLKEFKVENAYCSWFGKPGIMLTTDFYQRLQKLETFILRQVMNPVRQVPAFLENILSITSISKLVLEFTDPQPFTVKLDALKNLEHFELINRIDDEMIWNGVRIYTGSVRIYVSDFNPEKLKILKLQEVNMSIARDDQPINLSNIDCSFSKLEIFSIENEFLFPYDEVVH